MLRCGLLAVIGLALSFNATTSVAQERGFQLNRYEPTPAGEASFMVNRPQYSPTIAMDAGLTFDYGLQPFFVKDMTTGQDIARVDHLLITHVDLATSFKGRVLFALSMPITTWIDYQSKYFSAPAQTSLPFGWI
jgi:hypothetical protein